MSNTSFLLISGRLRRQKMVLEEQAKWVCLPYRLSLLVLLKLLTIQSEPFKLFWIIPVTTRPTTSRISTCWNWRTRRRACRSTKKITILMITGWSLIQPRGYQSTSLIFTCLCTQSADSFAICSHSFLIFLPPFFFFFSLSKINPRAVDRSWKDRTRERKKRKSISVWPVNAIASICIMLNAARMRNDVSFIPTAFLQIQITR